MENIYTFVEMYVRFMKSKAKFVFVSALLLCSLNIFAKEFRGVVVYPSDILSVGVKEWEKRIDESGINLIGLHAATFNEPLDTLKSFVQSKTGKQFLRMCKRKKVDVEYELHVLQLLLPRSFYDTKPELFRMNKQGKRMKQYNMCFTNEEAYELIRPQIAELMSWLHPTTHRYFLWPDDVVGSFCNCEKCSEYTPSEQSLIFENKILDMIREYDPKATLAHLSYYQTLDAPLKVSPKEGIFLEYAPISRNYADPLTPEHVKALEDNLKVFPASTMHILEYWLDESMFSNWKKKKLVKLPFVTQECARDIRQYRSYGATSITCFATWLNARYVEQYGPADDAFVGYGEAFKQQ